MDSLPQCDYGDPASVVRAFIAAMHRWETGSWQAMRAARSAPDPASYQPGVMRQMNLVFATYCTPRDRPYGRAGSFQKPPEYDPEREQVLSVEVEGRKALVDTRREADLGGGLYRYVLVKRAGEWRIDSLRFDDGGTWTRAIL